VSDPFVIEQLKMFKVSWCLEILTLVFPHIPVIKINQSANGTDG